MTSLISESTKDIEHYMDQGTPSPCPVAAPQYHYHTGRLDQFNEAIAAINSEMSYRCNAWNALNETNLPPSRRAPENWAVSPYNVSICEGTVWDPKHVITCGWRDPSASSYQDGICDPNGHCYYTAVSYQGVAKEIEEHILSLFTSSDAILGLHAFDKYVWLGLGVVLLHHAPLQ